MSPEQVRERFAEMFKHSAQAGLVELGETDVKLTPEGTRCLDEMLMYLEFHPRADVAKRSKRLRQAIHGIENG